MFQLLRTTAYAASRLTLNITPFHRQVGSRMDKAWPKLTKGLFRTIWHLLNHKSGEKRRRKGGISLFVMCVFCRNHYTYWRPASQEVADHRLLMGSTEEIFCFPLLPRTTSSFALLNSLYLDPQVFFFSILFSPSLPCWAVERLGRHLVCSQGQSTTAANTNSLPDRDALAESFTSK